jgi:hypothetical protein
MRVARELGGRLRRHPRRHGRPVTRPALARGIVVGWTHLGRSDRSRLQMTGVTAAVVLPDQAFFDVVERLRFQTVL